MQVRFWGAAHEVTGSMHQVNVGDQRILVDCGLVQGSGKEVFDRNSHFPFDPGEINAVVLSHAHVDHSGNLPSLGRQGFTGAIHTTASSLELCRYMLADSAQLQGQDAMEMQARGRGRSQIETDRAMPAVLALYTAEDVENVLGKFVPMHYGKEREIAPGVSVTLGNAGHILGSAFVSMKLRESNSSTNLLFSGDLERRGLPIIKDPAVAPKADYLILESTYGDRRHSHRITAKQKLRQAIERAVARGGRVIVPSFALGRTQQIVLLLHQLLLESSLPEVPIFVDSPLAINVMDVYRDHPEEFDQEAQQFLSNGLDPFAFGRLHYLRTAAESKVLNDVRKPLVVISSSGMCEGGRVLHHLKHGTESPQNLILLTGYQAEHTLGRSIAERQPVVSIMGEQYALRAEVVMLDELSCHADQYDLLEWVHPIAESLKAIFLVHGEPQSQAALAELLKKEFSVSVCCPARGDNSVFKNGRAPHTSEREPPGPLTALYAGRKRLSRLPEIMFCNWLQRLDCSSLVEMDDGVKLVRELRAKVVTRKF
jgi:metallo-beta-lactamase family protein